MTKTTQREQLRSTGNRGVLQCGSYATIAKHDVHCGGIISSLFKRGREQSSQIGSAQGLLVTDRHNGNAATLGEKSQSIPQRPRCNTTAIPGNGHMVEL